MSKLKYQLPVLAEVKILKDGNKSGVFTLKDGEGDNHELCFEGSLPFSRLYPSDWTTPSTKSSKVPTTERMNFARHCINLVLATHPHTMMPTKFRTLDGALWKIDKAVLHWLLVDGEYEKVERFGWPDYAIVPKASQL